MLQTIGGRIEADIEAPGHRLPTEHALMAQYACARMTVSKGLGALTARSLLTRRRRAGTLVASPAADRAMLEIEDFPNQAARLYQPYRHELLNHRARPATPSDSAELHLPEAAPILALSCPHVLGPCQLPSSTA